MYVNIVKMKYHIKIKCLQTGVFTRNKEKIPSEYNDVWADIDALPIMNESILLMPQN